MDSASELLYRQFANKRAGLRLVAVEPAALPVTVVSTTVLAQERKPLPLLEEFVIRSVANGFSAISEISTLLGLEEKLVANAVVDLAASGAIQYLQTAQEGRLTPAGLELSRELAAITPVERTFKPHFDRALWQVADYPRSDLVKKSLAVDEGRVLLPAKATKQITAANINLRKLNRILSGPDGRSQSMEVLRVLRAKAADYWYLRCWLLVYASDNDDTPPELAVIVGGAPSPEHDIAIEEAGGAEILKLRINRSDEAPALVLPAAISLALREQDEAGPFTDESGKSPPGTELVVRSLDMYEHRLVLQEALATANRRLLLVSPWVKSAVVDTQFLASLEGALRRGVQVHIVHGYGPDDRGSDERALRQLQSMQARFSEGFRLVRHPNTHAKVLIFDDVWIATSFNWLSFRGDAERTYRMEEGVLVRSPEHAEREYSQYVERMLLDQG
ncbi:phospholipase D-like domain-containing protein [Mycetocola sp. 2940]|uniref:phospholipase D-like domain-containing protein n=1 Tax=Mycetocola sp. 2940 TaxID=3156452 RepID=UPI003396D542